MALLHFNSEQVAPNQSFDPVPAGLYLAQIEESEINMTKSGTGQMLKLKWRILEGEFKNRVVFDRINIQNQNPKAEEIGQRQLSTLCHSVDVLQLKDSAQLHAIPVIIKVSVSKDESGKYADQNEVKDYRPTENIQQGSLLASPAKQIVPAVTTSAAAAPPAPGKPKAPWASNKAS